MAHRVQNILFVVVIALLAYTISDKSVFDWVPGDAYGRINGMMTSVQKSSDCKARTQADMTLPEDAVSQIPKANELLSKIFYKNRTALVHLHNMALNRALFYSYIFQKLNKSQSDFEYQPNWFYIYISVTADTNANKGIFNGSSLMFDNFQYYPNWLRNMDFNKTVPLFGAKSYRFDDTFDMGVILREPTGRTNVVEDLGAVSNYTHEGYKMAPYYSFWLPDRSDSEDSILKFTYSVGVKYSNETGKFIHDEFQSSSFFGPNSPGTNDKDEKLLPVRFTAPYYDCKKANKWIVSAASPVVDFMDRYSNWTHLRRPKFVGVAVMDIDFLRIEFNACPVSIGNPGPSYLSGVSKCHTKTTQCKHKFGKGFGRGGYVCICNSGFSYPITTNPPFQGGDLEKATEKEYVPGFKCHRTDFLRVLPVVEQSSRVSVDEGGNAEDIFLTDDLYSRRQMRSINSTAFRSQEEPRNRQGKYVREFSSYTKEQNSQNTKSKVTKGTGNKGKQLGQQNQQVNKKIANGKPLKVTTSETQKGTKKKETAKSHEKKDYIDQEYIPPNTQRTTPKKRKTKKRKRRQADFDALGFDRMQSIFRKIGSIKRSNCLTKIPSDLFLAGDVGYGAETQFDAQARFALRISHLLSNWMQNVIIGDNFGYLNGGGRIHYELLFGEVLANIMSDHKVLSSGIYYEPYVFEDWDGKPREFFGPFAYKRDGEYYAIDTAGLPKRYNTESWYQKIRQRWKTNTSGLKKYRMKAKVRSDINGTSSIKFEYFPMGYKAPSVTHGLWTAPYFRCDGRVDAWVITYAVPFIGLDSLRTSLKFKGVVTVDVPLEQLEINQCAQPFNIQNAFKNTARCDYKSQKCSPIAGYKFSRGAYKCACRQGFEYPFRDGRNFFQGSLIDKEYEKKMAGIFSLYDSLQCRTQGGSMVLSNFYIIVLMLVSTLTVNLQ